MDEPKANAEVTAPANPPATENMDAGQQTQSAATSQPSEDYKAIQRLLNQVQRTEQRIDEKLATFDGTLSDLKTRVEGTQALGLDLIAEINPASGEHIRRPTPNYAAHLLNQSDRQKQQERAYLNGIRDKAKRELREEHGIDPDSDAELKTLLAGEFTPETAYSITKAVARIAKEKTMSNQTSVEKMVEERVTKKLVDMGLLRADMSSGTTVVGTFTAEQISDRAFWKANKQKILEAQAKGLIKE